MAESSPQSDRPVTRRGFFAALLRQGITGAEAATQAVTSQLQQLAQQTAAQSAATSKPLRFLRPPGALPEPQFLDACTACGQCAKACPAQCIVIQPSRAGGKPHIVARQSPCVICDDLACMTACPSGALQKLTRDQIHMGLARVNHDLCLRSRHEECKVCVTQCPVGPTALTINAQGQLTVGDTCTGCGVCERTCPTEPASIVIEPRQL